MCWAPSEDEAQKTAHHYFRWAVTGWPVQAELPNTRGFEAATRHVTPEIVAQQVTCGPAAEVHLDAINRYVDAGYDHIILTQVGPRQAEFIEFFERQLAPALRRR